MCIVEMAMTKPIMPNARGIAMCQKRSPDLSECLYEHRLTKSYPYISCTYLVTANATRVANIQGGLRDVNFTRP